jgi:hypothetical protein
LRFTLVVFGSPLVKSTLLGNFSYTRTGQSGISIRYTKAISDVRVEDCRMRFATAGAISSAQEIPFADINLQVVRVERAWTAPGTRYDPEWWQVSLQARSGRPFYYKLDDGKEGYDQVARIDISTSQDADRVAAAVRHAARLCGATGSAF